MPLPQDLVTNKVYDQVTSQLFNPSLTKFLLTILISLDVHILTNTVTTTFPQRGKNHEACRNFSPPLDASLVMAGKIQIQNILFGQ
jgi:hypothetical protein